jgi:hypothetical protein
MTDSIVNFNLPTNDNSESILTVLGLFPVSLKCGFFSTQRNIARLVRVVWPGELIWWSSGRGFCSSEIQKMRRNTFDFDLFQNKRVQIKYGLNE